MEDVVGGRLPTRERLGRAALAGRPGVGLTDARVDLVVRTTVVA